MHSVHACTPGGMPWAAAAAPLPALARPCPGCAGGACGCAAALPARAGQRGAGAAALARRGAAARPAARHRAAWHGRALVWQLWHTRTGERLCRRADSACASALERAWRLPDLLRRHAAATTAKRLHTERAALLWLPGQRHALRGGPCAVLSERWPHSPAHGHTGQCCKTLAHIAPCSPFKRLCRRQRLLTWQWPGGRQCCRGTWRGSSTTSCCKGEVLRQAGGRCGSARERCWRGGPGPCGQKWSSHSHCCWLPGRSHGPTPGICPAPAQHPTPSLFLGKSSCHIFFTLSLFDILFTFILLQVP